MYSKEEFSKLKIEHKRQELISNGTYLIDRNYLYYLVYLYHYNGYYVEAWKTHFNELAWIEIAPKRSVLEVYHSKINLSDLKNELGF